MNKRRIALWLLIVFGLVLQIRILPPPFSLRMHFEPSVSGIWTVLQFANVAIHWQWYNLTVM